MKKFELTSESIVKFGRTLYRIRALAAFGNVKEGELGGFLEKEENLAQDGNAWVGKNATVCENATVRGNATVSGYATVCGDATVCGYATVCGDATVCGYATVCGDATVRGYATVCENATVRGYATVCENATVRGNATVSGYATVCGYATVRGYATVSGDAWVFKTSHYLVIGPMGSRNGFTTFFRTKKLFIGVACGCFKGNVDEFVEKVKETHGDNKHAKAYLAATELAKMQIDLTPEENEPEE